MARKGERDLFKETVSGGVVEGLASCDIFLEQGFLTEGTSRNLVQVSVPSRMVEGGGSIVTGDEQVFLGQDVLGYLMEVPSACSTVEGSNAIFIGSEEILFGEKVLGDLVKPSCLPGEVEGGFSLVVGFEKGGYLNRAWPMGKTPVFDRLVCFLRGWLEWEKRHRGVALKVRVERVLDSGLKLLFLQFFFNPELVGLGGFGVREEGL